ncbi:MAG: hypothetical protein JXA15_00580 [Spirochaetales bacterium]|nr:hypothetical protein [Spirochaetales bacterium]
MSGIKIRTGGAKGKKLTVGERREKNAQKEETTEARRHGGKREQSERGLGAEDRDRPGDRKREYISLFGMILVTINVIAGGK